MIYIDKGRYEEVIKIQPIPLNKGERDLVEDLKLYFNNNTDFFKDKQLYLLRNMSKKELASLKQTISFLTLSYGL